MDVAALLVKARESLHGGQSFGPIIERDGVLVIPVAFTAGGGGGGDGPGPHGEGEGGSGMGFGGVSWPRGVYVVKDGDVRWIPAVDATLVALGVLTLLRAVVRARSRRARHARA